MKRLIIYFSHTGENYMSDGIRNIDKGNTEIVADIIKMSTNADILKVEPVREYPYNYHECCGIAKKELEENIRPEVKNNLEEIGVYDIIYIGGPVWCGHYPTPLLTVWEKLDFKDKIIYPFTTHEASGLGYIMDDIKRICIGAKIKEGLAIRGSDANNSKEKIENWCK